MNYSKIGPIFFKVLLFVCGISLAGFIGYKGFNDYKNIKVDPPGYCRAQDRYISDEEFIRTVIPLVQADIKRTKPQWNDSSFYHNWDGYVPKSDDYSCCYVKREKTYSLFNRAFGLQDISVHVIPPGKSYGVVIFYFDVCGSLIDSDIGMPWANTPAITTTPYRK